MAEKLFRDGPPAEPRASPISGRLHPFAVIEVPKRGARRKQTKHAHWAPVISGFRPGLRRFHGGLVSGCPARVVALSRPLV